MKKTLLGFLAIASFGVATAQTNLDFEAWTSGGSYDDPDAWFTLNQFSGFGGPITVFKETAAPGGGLASVSMVTTLCALCPQVGESDTLPGFIRQEVAFTATSITSVDFQYLYNAVNGDEAVAFIQLTKWNVALDSAEVVAETGINLTNQPSWMSVNLPMVYLNTNTPDSLKITFGSSIAVLTQDYTYPQSQFGSELKIDDIVLNGAPTSVGITDFAEEVYVYSNEHGIVVNVEESISNARLEIYDITGKLIESTSMKSTSKIIPTNEYNSGVYLVKLFSIKGAVTKKVYVK